MYYLRFELNLLLVVYPMIFRIFILLWGFIFLLPINPLFASLDYGKQSLIGSDFSNNDLRGATFYLTDLQNADFSGSNLEGASLFGAKLENANLTNSNLRDVTLDSAVLDGTDLTNSVLEDAFAFNARFKDVIIRGADFTNVPFSKNQISLLCETAEGVNPITNRNTRDTLGCD